MFAAVANLLRSVVPRRGGAVWVALIAVAAACLVLVVLGRLRRRERYLNAEECASKKGTWNADTKLCTFKGLPEKVTKEQCASKKGTWNAKYESCKLPTQAPTAGFMTTDGGDGNKSTHVTNWSQDECKKHNGAWDTGKNACRFDYSGTYTLTTHPKDQCFKMKGGWDAKFDMCRLWSSSKKGPWQKTGKLSEAGKQKTGAWQKTVDASKLLKAKSTSDVEAAGDQVKVYDGCSYAARVSENGRSLCPKNFPRYVGDLQLQYLDKLGQEDRQCAADSNCEKMTYEAMKPLMPSK